MNIIQIGTNVGNDRVSEFLRENKNQITRVVLVDALQAPLIQAYGFYKADPSFRGMDIQFVQGVVSTVVNTGPSARLMSFYFPTDDASSAHASVSEHHLQVHNHPENIQFSMPMITVEEIVFDMFGDIDIDWLFIDTEGLDADILLALQNPKRYKNIVFEHTHTDGPFQKGQKYLEVLKRFTPTHDIVTEINDTTFKLK
jgi:hypothetical protein